MTDVATRPTDSPDDSAASEPRVEWTITEPKKRSPKKYWLGIGIPVVAVALVGGLAFVGTTFTAPGVSALGTDLSTMSVADVEQAISDGVANSTITVAVDGETKTFSGEDLGLSVDSGAASQTVKDSYRLWQIGDWNPGAIDADLTVDEAVTSSALSEAFADKYVDPINAKIEFVDGSYTVVPDEQGRGIDATSLAESVADQLANANPIQALASGEQVLAASASPSISVNAEITEIEALLTADEAKQTATKLNTAIGEVIFMLDGDTVNSVSSDKVASWLDVSVSEGGDVEVAADAGSIQSYADSLPAEVNREPVESDVIVDGAGNVLKTEKEGQDGYKVSSTDGAGEEIAAQLGALEAAAFALPGEKVAHDSTERFHRAVVSKSDGHTYFYESVNGGDEKLVNSMPMALGKPGHDTQVGEYSVYGQLTIQNMGSCDAEGNYVPGGKFDYCTANVPWVTYFNGDQGFHGTYWHNNFGAGAYMSHGCVNLRESDAEWVYRFLQVGSPVSVRA
ncbi:L,D-transpeptidase family protein [Microbacterium gubbeenense]|uniref:L,D-transpeptidase family protein n=1 Tax=Microbacterium gubbeenense TaxID=159896 RepID=UPI003F96B854